MDEKTENYITAIHSSVWDVQVSLKNGYHDRKDLPILEATRDKLLKRPDGKTMLRLVETRIRKLSKGK